jgi:Mlc titration factor MtfA (ptsG expression regulator)
MCPSLAAIPPEILFWSIVAVLIGWWLVMRLRRVAGVWRLRYFALPRTWLKSLHRHVPLYNRLPWELRAPYQDKVLNFIDSKIFRSAGGMDEVTEVMRVIIAGHAGLLLLNSENDVIYPEVLTVHVYPQNAEDAHARGLSIAMLWDETKMQATDPRDRGNESLAGIASALGLKALPGPLLLTAWARTRMKEFNAKFPNVLEEVTAGEESDVFAVATEAFYTAPAALRQGHPALYEALRQFYKIDPARWPSQK